MGVVSEPGFFAELGEPIVLYRDCVTAGDRGLWIPDWSESSSPVPIQRISEDSADVYCESRRSTFAGRAGVPAAGRVAELENEVKALRKEQDELQAKLSEAPPAPRGSLRDRVGLGPADGGGGPGPRAPQGGPAPEPAEDPKGDDDGDGDDERALWVDVDEHN